MSRYIDHDCVFATATAILEMVASILRPEEQRELFGMVCTALEAMLINRDELQARERKRLAKPSDN